MNFLGYPAHAAAATAAINAIVGGFVVGVVMVVVVGECVEGSMATTLPFLLLVQAARNDNNRVGEAGRFAKTNNLPATDLRGVFVLVFLLCGKQRCDEQPTACFPGLGSP